MLGAIVRVSQTLLVSFPSRIGGLSEAKYVSLTISQSYRDLEVGET